MSELEKALDQFHALMLAKFHRRAERHPKDDVCVDANFLRLTPSDIDRHYWAEIEERWAPGSDPVAIASEDVDVANMAFLSWFVRKAKTDTSLDAASGEAVTNERTPNPGLGY